MHTRLRALPARLRFFTDSAPEGGAGEPGTQDPAGEPSGDDPANSAGEPDPEGADALGDAGKQALDRMKAERKAARDRARELEQERDALKAQIEGRESEHKAEQEAQRVRDDALAAASRRVLRSEIKAKAGGRLNDPADALMYLDLDQFEADEQGDFDGDAIAAALDDLLIKKPYLAAQGGRRFQGGADGGTRNGTRPTQLSQQDLAGMKPEQIATAKAEGRLNDLLGVK
jgi:hypothetical protein